MLKNKTAPGTWYFRYYEERDCGRVYLTVDPQTRKVVVSKRIKEEFENGREYYKLEGQVLREPSAALARPSLENLEYHAYTLFR